MRILLVSSLYYPKIIGGAEVSTQLLAEALTKDNMAEVHVLTTGESDIDEYINGVQIHRRRMSNISSFWDFKSENNYGKRIIYKLLDFYSLANKKIIEQLLKEIHPDVVHVNTIYGFSPIIWSVSKNMGVPVVNTYRDYYVMCPRANLMSKGKACSYPNIICRGYRKLFSQFLRKIDMHVAISDFVRNKILDQLGIESEVVFNSIQVDYGLFKKCCDQKKYTNNEKRKFVYVGSLIPTKGILEFAKEFAGLQDIEAELHILGEGILRKDIESLNCKNIIMHGFVTGEEKHALLMDMDISVCPSLWEEPFGRVVIESYQYAMPVIGSNMGGIPELILPGTGIICDPYIHGTLTQSLRHYTNDWKGLTVEDKAQMLELLKKFDISIQLDKYKSIYSRLIQGEQR